LLFFLGIKCRQGRQWSCSLLLGLLQHEWSNQCFHSTIWCGSFVPLTEDHRP
jgi:hypothetical protein